MWYTENNHSNAKKVINRLSKITGHIDAIKEMYIEDRDCSEVSIQIAIVKSALTNVGRIILDDLKDAIEKFLKLVYLNLGGFKMWYLAFKTLISAIIIVSVSEISKRSSLLGAILASLPLVSYLGMIWLYIDTNSKAKVSELSISVFWMVIPSLSLFIVLHNLLKTDMNFYLALFLSTVIMVIIYFIMVFILHKVGINI